YSSRAGRRSRATAVKDRGIRRSTGAIASEIVLFTEPLFLFLFLPLLLALYFFVAGAAHGSAGRAAHWLLVVASLIFYAQGVGGVTWLMLASIAFNYLMAIGIDRLPSRRRTILAAAISVNLTVLGIFKYANFFADNVDSLFLVLGAHPFVVPKVLLPI